MRLLVLISILVVSTCGIVYELVAGTVASYLLGDTIGQFSTVIGVYLFSMGVGSFCSKYIKSNYTYWFVYIEILIALLGAITPVLLFILFEEGAYFKPTFYFSLFFTGALVGLEIPLLMRILKNESSFNDLVADVFTFDYIGALFASLAFPSLLIPYLGIIKTSCVFSILNVVTAMVFIFYFKQNFPHLKRLLWLAFTVFLIVLGIFLFSNKIIRYVEHLSYDEHVVATHQTSYQKLTITKNYNDVRLYINGNLQFSSLDEYRYHEALVQPAIGYGKNVESVLVLGGGDGLAVKEILKHRNVKSVVLVDLDPKMTELFKSTPLLTQLNKNALKNPKVKVHNTDAFVWLKEKCNQKFDCIIIDFPDPSNYSLGKLYTYSFFKYLKRAIHSQTVISIQSTSPYYARQSFWCVYNTIKEVGFHTKAYHAHVPSFGEWGFVLFSPSELKQKSNYLGSLKFLNQEIWKSMQVFPTDMSWCSTPVNHLNNQALVTFFEHEWSRFK